MPSKDELCYPGPALTQRRDCLLQFLVHASLKGRAFYMRKGHALNAPNDPIFIRRRSNEDLLVMRQWNLETWSI